MKIDRSNFKDQEKKLKRHFKEQKILEKIILHIKQCETCEELSQSPISMLYGFEKLKYFSNEYYSFNLCKNGGVIRLICSINKEYNIISLEFVSMNHYDDFKRKNK